MGFIDETRKLGFDVEDAMERFMNNEALFKAMVKKLPETIYPSRFGGNKSDDLEFISLIEAGDITNAIAKSHTLKGMMGNISATAFYKAYTQIVGDLRANNTERALALAKKIQQPLDQLLNKIVELKDME